MPLLNTSAEVFCVHWASRALGLGGLQTQVARGQGKLVCVALTRSAPFRLVHTTWVYPSLGMYEQKPGIKGQAACFSLGVYVCGASWWQTRDRLSVFWGTQRRRVGPLVPWVVVVLVGWLIACFAAPASLPPRLVGFAEAPSRPRGGLWWAFTGRLQCTDWLHGTRQASGASSCVTRLPPCHLR